MKENEKSVHILQKFVEGAGSCRVCADARDHHRYRMGDLLPDRSRRLDQECVRKCVEPYGDGEEEWELLIWKRF